MQLRHIPLIFLALTLGALPACDRSAKPVSSSAAPTTAATPAPPPAKAMIMVCRDSQSGRKAICGTPNAVMVGMKPQ